MIGRRALLLGGLGGLGTAAAMSGTGYALVENEVLPGEVRLDRALGRCGEVPAPPAASAAVQRLTWRSAHRRTTVTATIVPPAAGRSLRGLPVAVASHGSGSARRLGGERTAAVVASSPALFGSSRHERSVRPDGAPLPGPRPPGGRDGRRLPRRRLLAPAPARPARLPRPPPRRPTGRAGAATRAGRRAGACDRRR
ncbi:hypothetical protein [Actinomadura chokoriensis]|uniref:hypothetical protein n=1 Tax=Actinomadura chokoriensis TaxID=454156 RepID=UPI0031F8BA95